MIFAWTYQERLSGEDGICAKAWICRVQRPVQIKRKGLPGSRASVNKDAIGEHVDYYLPTCSWYWDM